MNDRRRRVAPLAPEQRRAALIAATLPLLRAEGLNVSTRKIAECAGVAEGTIFRAFPDKTALISATLAYAFDPGPTIESIDAVAADPDVRFRLRTAIRVITRRFRENHLLVFAIKDTAEGDAGSAYQDAQAGLEQIVDAVTRLLEPDQHRLRLPARTVAWLVISLIMCSHRSELPSGDDLVTVVLDGVLYPGVKDAHQAGAPPPAAL